MIDIRNIDLKTASKVVTSETAAITIGGQVAPNMKRWVTFLGLDSMLVTGASSVRLYLASVGVSNPTKASLIATGNRKMLLDLRATGVVRDSNLTPDGVPLLIPDRPDVNKPLFSIAGGKWLGAYASYTTANVTMQFFDE
jgi:hypothetical protein